MHLPYFVSGADTMRIRFLTVLSMLLCGTSASMNAQPQPTVWDSVGTILQARVTQGGAYQRFNLPRRDLSLRVGDLAVSPSLGLGAWVGFVGAPEAATMMGDLVVIPGELKAVLAELSRQDIDVTAIHNHLAAETPSIRNVHFHAEGRATDLAMRLDKVLAHTATPRPVATLPARPLGVDTAMVRREWGPDARAQGDVVTMTFMLVPGPITMHGHPVDASLALRSPIAVQFIDSTRAVGTGDFTVLGPRVDPVLDALAANGITATAVHSHMIGEQPTTYYVHFWADGRPLDVLKGLRAAAEAGRTR
jgi:hypothetical protein